MFDFSIVDLVLTTAAIVYIGLFFGKLMLLADAATKHLKSRTEIDREKFNHDRINGKI